MQHPDYPNIEFKPAIASYDIDQICDLLLHYYLVFPDYNYISIPLKRNVVTVIQRFSPIQYLWASQYSQKLYQLANYFNFCLYNFTSSYRYFNISSYILENENIPVFNHSNRYLSGDDYSYIFPPGKYRFTWLMSEKNEVLFNNVHHCLFVSQHYYDYVSNGKTEFNFKGILNKYINFLKDTNTKSFCANSLVISKYNEQNYVDVTHIVDLKKNFLLYTDIDNYFQEIKLTYENYVNQYSFWINGIYFDDTYLDFLNVHYPFFRTDTKSKQTFVNQQLKIPMPLGHYFNGYNFSTVNDNNTRNLIVEPKTLPIPSYIRNTISLRVANNNYWNNYLYELPSDLGTDVNHGFAPWFIPVNEIWRTIGSSPFDYEESLNNYMDEILLNGIIFAANFEPNPTASSITFKNLTYTTYSWNGISNEYTSFPTLRVKDHPIPPFITQNRRYISKHTGNIAPSVSTVYFTNEIVNGLNSGGYTLFQGASYITSKYKPLIISHAKTPVDESCQILISGIDFDFYLLIRHKGFFVRGEKNVAKVNYFIESIEYLHYSYQKIGNDIVEKGNKKYNDEASYTAEEIAWTEEQWNSILIYHKNNQISEIEHYNKINTKNKKNTMLIKLEEIHAAIQASKYAGKLDKNGDYQNASFSLGDRISLIAQALGINYKLDGSIVSVKQREEIEIENNNVQVPNTHPIGQWAFYYDENNLPQLGTVYRPRSRLINEKELDKDTSQFNNPDKAYIPSPFVKCHNILQFYESLLDNLNKVFNMEELSAIVIPNASEPAQNGDLEKDLPYYSVEEGLGHFLAQILHLLGKMDERLLKTFADSLITKMTNQELLKATGLPTSKGELPYEYNNKARKIIYPTIANDAPSLLTQNKWILSNLGTLIGNSIQNVKIALDNKPSVEDDPLGMYQNISTEPTGFDFFSSFEIKKDGLTLYIKHWD